MAQKLTGGLPGDTDLTQNWQIRFDAVDPTTGAAISGVTVSNIAFLVELQEGTTVGMLQVGPFMLVPGPNA